MEKTRVVFRQWPNGDIIALFPQIPADNQGYTCSSYEHIGQHGGANPDVVVGQTTYVSSLHPPLAKELEELGYDLEVGQVCTAHDREVRRQQAKKNWEGE